ncbi:MAG: ABC transporter ATP-binding protein [Telmatospirillum sp.]|nr:ABC transporter ATP-binding protein [Telmatospirillum sp.]
MIEIVAATKSYGAAKALCGVDLTIGAGEAFGLLGPNGAGKSTLVRLLATLSRPDGGHLRVGGHDTVRAASRVKRLLGVVFQENNLDRDLSARQNLLFHAGLYGLGRAADRVAAMIGRLGLSGAADRPVGQLSGGQRRRLVIGRALLPEPRVLLLDEPTTGLDPAVRRELWDLIRHIRDGGCTIVLTTHYVEEAEALCGRIGIIRQGRMAALGTPDELVARFGGPRLEDVVVRLGAGGGA